MYSDAWGMASVTLLTANAPCSLEAQRTPENTPSTSYLTWFEPLLPSLEIYGFEQSAPALWATVISFGDVVNDNRLIRPLRRSEKIMSTDLLRQCLANSSHTNLDLHGVISGAFSYQNSNS